MKKTFMIEFELPDTFSEAFLALIPQQRLFIDNLLADGTVKSYSLALDRSRLWTVLIAESEIEVVEIIKTMPLRDHMLAHISQLMFHNVAEQMVPFSLN